MPGTRSFSVTGETATALHELTGRAGVTPFMVFASALSGLIHSGSDERETVMLGTLIAQRDRDRWREVVGPLLNVGVLAVDLAMRDTGLEALSRTLDGALRAYRASHLPYQDLLRMLGPALAPDGSPFEVLLVMQPERREQPGFDGLTSQLVELETGVSPYPLVVDVEPRAGGYLVTHRFAPQRYDAAEVAALAASYATVLQKLVRHPDRTLAELLPGQSTGGEGDR